VIFKTGDKVLCVREKDLPYFVGAIWIVDHIGESNGLIYCKNKELLYRNEIDPSKINAFPFKKDEIVLVTPLIEELL
jgi:hypothetical protein